MSRWMRLGIATITSTALVGGALVTVPSHPLLSPTQVASAQDVSAQVTQADGTVIDLGLLRGLIAADSLPAFENLLEAISAESEFVGDSNTGPDYSSLDITLFQGINLDLGILQLPLVDDGSGNGLLDLGTGGVGALGAYATTPAVDRAEAAAGVVSEDGSVDLDPTVGSGNVETTVQLTALLDQLGLSGLTDELVDDLSLRLGAVSSKAVWENGEVTAEYALANAQLSVGSPLLEKVGNLVKPGGLGAGLDSTVEALLGEKGLLDGVTGVVGGILDGLGLASISGPTLETNIEATLDALLGNELTSASGLVSLNLPTGEIQINLEQLHGENLSNLDPNTPLVNDAQIAQIVVEITSLLDALVKDISDAVNQGLLETKLGLSAEITVPVVGNLLGSLTIDTTLGQLLDGSQDGITGTGVLGAVGALANGLTSLVGDILGEEDASGEYQVTLLDNLIGTLTEPLTELLAVDTGIGALINEVLGEVLQITVNAQSNELQDPRQGERPNSNVGTPEASDQPFDIAALHIQVLGLGSEGGVIDLPLSRSTVVAQEAEDPTDEPTTTPPTDEPTTTPPTDEPTTTPPTDEPTTTPPTDDPTTTPTTPAGSSGDDFISGSSDFLQKCMTSPAGAITGILAVLGTAAAIGGPAIEPLVKALGGQLDAQLRAMSSNFGVNQPAWAQGINKGLNDAANAIDSRMVAAALFATALGALVAAPALCEAEGSSGSSGSSI